MPRKPKQSRSRATVDAIVEAGFITIAQYGVAVSTKQIADTAGVSVGSLYEYFSNKEAIFEAMQERFVADVVALIAELMPDMVALPVEEGTSLLLSRFKALLLANNRRYLQAAYLLIQHSSMKYAEPIREMLRNVVVLIAQSRPEYAHLKNLPTMSYIMIHGGIYLFLENLSTPNPAISFDELTQGLIEVVTLYVSAK